MTRDGKNRAALTRRGLLGCAAGALGVAAAPVREEPEEVIPLKTLVATSQQGLLEVPWGRILKSEYLSRLVDSRQVGPANLFLVVGKDINTALDATCAAFFCGLAVDRPVLRPGDQCGKKDHFWAFVYFGASQTSPCEWAVTRASISGIGCE